MHIFKEDYPDPFEDTVCQINEATYDTLPIVDGNIFSGNQIIAGAYPTDLSGKPIMSSTLQFTQNGEHSALVDYGAIRFTLMEDWLKITADEDFVLENRVGKTDRHFPTLVSCDNSTLQLSYNGVAYGLQLTCGRFDGPNKICSEDGIIELHIV